MPGKIDAFFDEPVKVLMQNPKRGKSAERYDRYKKAKTLGEVLTLGGLRADISNDVKRGFIMIKDKSRHKQLLAVLNETDVAPVKAPKPASPKASSFTVTKAAKVPPSPVSGKITKVSKPAKQIEKREESALRESALRKRAALATEDRVSKFGRSIGKGRWLPIFH